MSENPDPSPSPETPSPAVETEVASMAPPGKEERTIGMLCHLLAFTGLMIPGAHIVAPLVLWLVKKDSMPFADYHGKESLNFQITVTLFVVACMLLSFLILPILIGIAAAVAAFVLTILRAISANDGKKQPYPYTIRFIK